VAPGELTEAVRRRPFIPFRLTFTEGSAYEIRHPELCMVGRRSAILGLKAAADDPDHLFERSVNVDLLHIVKLEYLEATPAPQGNGPA
jgi:hypothetical protein